MNYPRLLIGSAWLTGRLLQEKKSWRRMSAERENLLGH